MTTIRDDNSKRAVYISGPISNLPNGNYDEFQRAENELIELGYGKIYNPRRQDDIRQIKFSEAAYGNSKTAVRRDHGAALPNGPIFQ